MRTYKLPTLNAEPEKPLRTNVRVKLSHRDYFNSKADYYGVSLIHLVIRGCKAYIRAYQYQNGSEGEIDLKIKDIPFSQDSYSVAILSDDADVIREFCYSHSPRWKTPDFITLAVSWYLAKLEYEEKRKSMKVA